MLAAQQACRCSAQANDNSRGQHFEVSPSILSFACHFSDLLMRLGVNAGRGVKGVAQHTYDQDDFARRISRFDAGCLRAGV